MEKLLGFRNLQEKLENENCTQPKWPNQVGNLDIFLVSLQFLHLVVPCAIILIHVGEICDMMKNIFSLSQHVIFVLFCSKISSMLASWGCFVPLGWSNSCGKATPSEFFCGPSSSPSRQDQINYRTRTNYKNQCWLPIQLDMSSFSPSSALSKVNFCRVSNIDKPLSTYFSNLLSVCYVNIHCVIRQIKW